MAGKYFGKFANERVRAPEEEEEELTPQQKFREDLRGTFLRATDPVCKHGLTPEFLDDLRGAIWAAHRDGYCSEEDAREMTGKLFEIGAACHGDDWYGRLPDVQEKAWRQYDTTLIRRAMLK